MRLVRRSSPGDVVVLEPKRHRSARISHLEDLEFLLELEDPLDDSAPLHLDMDVLSALSQEEVVEALNWPLDGNVQADDLEDDPFNHGVSLG